MDTAWVLDELKTFLGMTTLVSPQPTPGLQFIGDFRHTQAEDADIIPAAQIVEQILSRVLPDWRTAIPVDGTDRWQQHHEAALRAVAKLERQAEVDERLGENAPRMNAAQLHPWVWGGASSLWRSGHLREAVRAAAVKVNAEAQNKLGTRDLSETALFQMAFSSDQASIQKPRLRLPEDDHGRTARSVRRGMMAFAEGCYAALRNPTSHDLLADIPEQEALDGATGGL